MTEDRRYHLIDALRAVAVLNMIAYHLVFDLSYTKGVWDNNAVPAGIVVWERLIGGAFILLSGVSVNFSRHGYRRGLTVALCAAGVTVFSLIFIPELTVWFGVLHFLAVAMLLTHALMPLLRRVDPFPGAAVCFALYALFYGITERYLGCFTLPLITLPSALYQVRWLSIFGFLTEDFVSGDYFPILPLIFLYWFGFYLWRLAAQRRLDRFFFRKIPVLDFIGRHSLIIYLIHQPVLYGLCRLIASGG